MTNPYGVVLDDASVRWAAAESVPETVIAAICLLETRSVDEIVARLTPAELEQVIKIVGRSPRGYPPGAYDALKGHRRLSPHHSVGIGHGPKIAFQRVTRIMTRSWIGCMRVPAPSIALLAPGARSVRPVHSSGRTRGSYQPLPAAGRFSVVAG